MRVRLDQIDEKIALLRQMEAVAKTKCDSRFIFQVFVWNDSPEHFDIIPLEIDNFVNDIIITKHPMQSNDANVHIDDLREGNIRWCPNYRLIYSMSKDLDERVKKLLGYKHPTQKQNLKKLYEVLNSL